MLGQLFGKIVNQKKDSFGANVTSSLSRAGKDALFDYLPSFKAAKESFENDVKPMIFEGDGETKNLINKYSKNIKNTLKQSLEDIKVGKVYNGSRSEASMMEAMGIDSSDFDEDLFSDMDDNVDKDKLSGDEDYNADFEDEGKPETETFSDDDGTVNNFTKQETKSTHIRTTKSNVQLTPLIEKITKGVTAITEVNSEGYKTVAEAIRSQTDKQSDFFDDTSSKLADLANSLKNIEDIYVNSVEMNVSSRGSIVNDILGGNLSMGEMVESFKSKYEAHNKKNNIWTKKNGIGAKLASYKKDLLGSLFRDAIVSPSLKALNSATGGMLKNTDRFLGSAKIKGATLLDNIANGGDMITGPLAKWLDKQKDKTDERSILGRFLREKNLGDKARNLDLSKIDTVFSLLGISPDFSVTDIENMNQSAKKSANEKVYFDAETHTTINKVLPGYFAKILAGLAGSEEIYMDYQSGKWQTVSAIRHEADENRDKAAMEDDNDFFDMVLKGENSFIKKEDINISWGAFTSIFKRNTEGGILVKNFKDKMNKALQDQAAKAKYEKEHANDPNALPYEDYVKQQEAEQSKEYLSFTGIYGTPPKDYQEFEKRKKEFARVIMRIAQGEDLKSMTNISPQLKLGLIQYAAEHQSTFKALVFQVKSNLNKYWNDQTQISGAKLNALDDTANTAMSKLFKDENGNMARASYDPHDSTSILKSMDDKMDKYDIMMDILDDILNNMRGKGPAQGVKPTDRRSNLTPPALIGNVFALTEEQEKLFKEEEAQASEADKPIEDQVDEILDDVQKKSEDMKKTLSENMAEMKEAAVNQYEETKKKLKENKDKAIKDIQTKVDDTKKKFEKKKKDFNEKIEEIKNSDPNEEKTLADGVKAKLKDTKKRSKDDDFLAAVGIPSMAEFKKKFGTKDGLLNLAKEQLGDETFGVFKKLYGLKDSVKGIFSGGIGDDAEGKGFILKNLAKNGWKLNSSFFKNIWSSSKKGLAGTLTGALTALKKSPSALKKLFKSGKDGGVLDAFGKQTFGNDSWGLIKGMAGGMGAKKFKTGVSFMKDLGGGLISNLKKGKKGAKAAMSTAKGVGKSLLGKTVSAVADIAKSKAGRNVAKAAGVAFTANRLGNLFSGKTSAFTLGNDKNNAFSQDNDSSKYSNKLTGSMYGDDSSAMKYSQDQQKKQAVDPREQMAQGEDLYVGKDSKSPEIEEEKKQTSEQSEEKQMPDEDEVKATLSKSETDDVQTKKEEPSEEEKLMDHYKNGLKAAGMSDKDMKDPDRMADIAFNVSPIAGSANMEDTSNSRVNKAFNDMQSIAKSLKEAAKAAKGGGGSSSGGSSSSSSQTAATVSGNDNASKLYNTLVKNGFTAEAASALLGNAQGESNFDTHANNGNHIGIFQWDTANRWQNLVSWAKSEGKDPYDIETQALFAIKEMQEGGYKDDIAKMTNVQDAVIKFEQLFERSGGQANEKRIQYGKEWYEKLGKQQGDAAKKSDDKTEPALPAGEGETSASGSNKSNNAGIEKMIEWGESKKGNVTYSMLSRTGPSSYDCSSFVYYSMKNGGFEVPNYAWNTMAMDDFADQNKYIKYIDKGNVQRGDLFIMGVKGASAGADGHTGIFLDNGNTILHCNGRANGVSENNFSIYQYAVDGGVMRFARITSVSGDSGGGGGDSSDGGDDSNSIYDNDKRSDSFITITQDYRDKLTERIKAMYDRRFEKQQKSTEDYFTKAKEAAEKAKETQKNMASASAGVMTDGVFQNGSKVIGTDANGNMIILTPDNKFVTIRDKDQLKDFIGMDGTDGKDGELADPSLNIPLDKLAQLRKLLEIDTNIETTLILIYKQVVRLKDKKDDPKVGIYKKILKNIQDNNELNKNQIQIMNLIYTYMPSSMNY